ncbi:MAG: DinB family protein [Thiohalocapsa sp.]|jgi:hypothetical protein|uniref:DinB family protein n=1 Tax=Thiohalocapsa sp. TaxID=2497641 RepID=UPI0025E0D638|nr:DinB family protein [Thiohalocapsa sp.]MCG6940571.1 DinB family protein [Thiohalocapsa sp.]
MRDRATPELDPPGAGIPGYERQVIGAGLRAAANFLSKDRLTELFRAEAEEAMALARGIDEDQGRRRVLVGRLFGMEDSSRDWSIYMTLEHLVIVNSAIAATLPRLFSGLEVSDTVRVQDFKPVPEAGPEQLEDLANIVERYTDMVDKLGNLRAGIRYTHPWFGELSAAQWHALAAVHNSVHRRQVKRIMRAL